MGEDVRVRVWGMGMGEDVRVRVRVSACAKVATVRLLTSPIDGPHLLRTYLSMDLTYGWRAHLWLDLTHGWISPIDGSHLLRTHLWLDDLTYD